MKLPRILQTNAPLRIKNLATVAAAAFSIISIYALPFAYALHPLAHSIKLTPHLCRLASPR
jgi:hypothetical protein